MALVEKETKQLLHTLVADKLGRALTRELLHDVEMRIFDSYLLRDTSGTAVQQNDFASRVFSSRGGVDYFRPDGWVQVWVTAIDTDPDFAEIREWPVAYHGTDSNNLASILEAGLRKPGELPSVQVAHGQAGAGPSGAIYATPSLWLSSHPVYSTFLRVRANRWVQFVFKLRVRPGSYRMQPSTLAHGKHWNNDLKLDPNFHHNEALEWLIEDSRDVLVVGLMMRELGANVDAKVFGGLARKVRGSSTEDAQYCWTDLLQQALMSGGYVVDRGKLAVGNTSIEWHLGTIADKMKAYSGGQSIRSSSFELQRLCISSGYLEFYPNGDIEDDEDEASLEIFLNSQRPLCLEVQIGKCTQKRFIMPQQDSSYIFDFGHDAIYSAQDDEDALAILARAWLPKKRAAQALSESVFYAREETIGVSIIASDAIRALLLPEFGAQDEILSEEFKIGVRIASGVYCDASAYLTVKPCCGDPWPDYCSLKVAIDGDDCERADISFELKLGWCTKVVTTACDDSDSEEFVLYSRLADVTSEEEVRISVLLHHCRLI